MHYNERLIFERLIKSQLLFQRLNICHWIPLSLKHTLSEPEAQKGFSEHWRAMRRLLKPNSGYCRATFEGLLLGREPYWEAMKYAPRGIPGKPLKYRESSLVRGHKALNTWRYIWEGCMKVANTNPLRSFNHHNRLYPRTPFWLSFGPWIMTNTRQPIGLPGSMDGTPQPESPHLPNKHAGAPRM